jgi:hypothetical protein
MSHDIACRINAFPPVRTAFLRIGRFRLDLPVSLKRPKLFTGKPRRQPKSSDHGIAMLYFIAYLREWVREQAKEKRTGSNLDRKSSDRTETGQRF